MKIGWRQPRKLLQSAPKSHFQRRWLSISLLSKIGFGIFLMLIMMGVAIGGAFLQVNNRSRNAVRLQMATQQAVLGQQIAKLALWAADGDATVVPQIESLMQEFETSLAILQNGDASRALPPASPMVQNELTGVANTWQSIQADVINVSENTVAIARFNNTLDKISAQSGMLSVRTVAALSSIESNTSGMGIFVVRQQQFLIQRLLELVVAISRGNPDAVTGLRQVSTDFNANLSALVNGDNRRNISPMSGDARETLLALESVWRSVDAQIQILLTNAEIYTHGMERAATITATSNELLLSSESVVNLMNREAAAETTQILMMLLGLGALFMLIFIGILWFIRRALRPLQTMIEVSGRVAHEELPALTGSLNRLAEGDLTGQFVVAVQPVQIRSQDEVGRMALALNEMIEQLGQAATSYNSSMQNLQGLVRRVQGSAQAVTEFSQQLHANAVQSGSATQQIAAVIAQVALGGMEQNQQLGMVAGSLEEQQHWIERIAAGAENQSLATTQADQILAEEFAGAIAQAQQTADEGRRLMGNADQTVTVGAKAVERTVAGIHAIAKSAQDVAERVAAVDQAARRIDTVVQKIDEIAERTNLLALNAAIEAAAQVNMAAVLPSWPTKYASCPIKPPNPIRRSPRW